MKKTVLFAAAALVLAACNKEEQGPAAAGRTELRLASGIEAATRGEVQSTSLVEGETVYVWVSDAGTDGALYNATELTAGQSGALAGTTPMYFPQTGNEVNIRALHGSFAEGTFAADAPFPASVGFTVAADQHEAGGAGYVQSDLLYATSDNVARTKQAVPLRFYHMLSKLELKIVKGAGVTDAITKVTLDGVAVDGMFTPAEGADLSDQPARAAMITPGDAPGTMTLGGTFWDETGKTTNDAIVVPQTIGGKTMTFTLASGGELVYTIPAGKTFESGKKHVYTVTLKLTGVEVSSTIEPWDDSEDPIEGDATLPAPAKIGDYFYSDGTYSTELDPEKTVIGIVFQTDPARIGEAEKTVLAAKGVEEPHGLVMAVKNAATSVQWSTDTSTDIPGLDNVTTVAACYKDINGLKNTQTVWEYAGYTSNKDTYPAFKAVEDFNTNNSAPKNATQWFMPSAGQLWDLLENLGKVEALKAQRENTAEEWYGKYTGNNICANLDSWLANVANADRFSDDYYFWSSSGISSSHAQFWGVVSDGRVFCYWNLKDSRRDVRPVLAF